MEKGKLKKVAATVAVGTILVGNLTVFAASQLQQVNAWINYDLKMKLNGKTFAPTEADGTAIRPITYNNRTYLPVAALGNALGVAVNWDGETQTVIIGEGDKVTDLTGIIDGDAYKATLAWQYTENKELLYAGGKTFDSGWILKKGYNIYDARDLKFNVKGGYSKLGFTLATDTSKDFSFNIIGDNGEVIDTIDVSEGIQEVEVDIGGHNSVYFAFPYSSNGADQKVVFGDIYVK